MAKNPWALPDGYDDTVKKALKNLFASLKNAKKAIPPAALEAVRMGDWEAFQRMMNWQGVEGSFDIFKQILADEAKAAAVSFYRNGGVGAKLTFDLIDERAVFYASTRAAELVTEITNDMRANIRNTITSATLGEKTWQQAAEEINAVLPLTTKNAEAVSKYQTRQYERFIKNGLKESVARAKADKLRDAYAEKLTQSRASTIARTEIASAASEGRFLGWEAGIESGLVDTASVKEWIAEPSACEICADMDGKTVPWDDEFPAGMMMPPAHPNCRCSAAILPPDFADSVFTNQALIKSKANQFEVEFAKHLSGKHDQSSHAGGRAATIESKPALRSFAKADWSSLPQATAENLSIDEQVALMSYQNNGYLGVNQYLRNQTFSGSVFYQADAETLTNAVNRFTIDQDVVVKRGVDPSAFGLRERSKAEDFMALKGKAFVDKAFLSTATFTNGSKVIANPFFDNKSVQMKISVPKGSKGMATNPLEGEFLMPPDTTLFISDVRESNNGYEIDAEVVGQ